DDVERARAREQLLIRNAVYDIEPGQPCMLGRFLCELDADDIVVARRLLEKEAIRASELQQPAAISVAADKRKTARKLLPQDGLGSHIIGIAVRVAAPEIVS